MNEENTDVIDSLEPHIPHRIQHQIPRTVDNAGIER